MFSTATQNVLCYGDAAMMTVTDLNHESCGSLVRVRSLCNGYPLRYAEGGGGMTVFGPIQASPQGGA
jgi:hypothetical protein